MKINKYTVVITQGNHSLYSRFLIFLICMCSIAFFSCIVSFISFFQIAKEIQTAFRLTFVTTIVLIFFLIKFKPPMDFIEGIKMNEKGVDLILNKQLVLWEEIESIKIIYKSYKGETKRTFSYFIQQNGFNNDIILNYSNRQLKYSFYVESAEEANRLFDCVSFLKAKNKPIHIEHFGRN